MKIRSRAVSTNKDEFGVKMRSVQLIHTMREIDIYSASLLLSLFDCRLNEYFNSLACVFKMHRYRY